MLQSTKFDPDGKYIKMWVPELENVPSAFIHDPWNMLKPVQKKYGVQIGGVHTDKSLKYYPRPIKCEKYTSAAATEKVAKSMKSKFRAELSEDEDEKM